MTGAPAQRFDVSDPATQGLPRISGPLLPRTYLAPPPINPFFCISASTSCVIA
jgi:hypothetical protein